MRAARGILLLLTGFVVATVPSPGAAADTGCTLVGTVGTPEIGVGNSTAGFETMLRAEADLPAQVLFRTSTESFNRRWSFAARHGHIFVKEAAVQGDWRALPLPGCMAGRIRGVSADDDEVMAVDLDGRFFTMDHALSAPRDWNWSTRFGTPLWTGPGNALPAGTLDWTWSVLSPNEDHVWRDTAGNDHPVGGAKVSHVFALTDAGARIRYIDPWLPIDHSYEMATPENGRFRATALSTSGSTSLVINNAGDLYTRLFDFDISGADKVFFRYSYADQRGRPEAPDMLAERVDPATAAIQLPAPTWTRQPAIPGESTNRISIHKTGIGSDARELRVEGVDANRTGYWTKPLTAPAWTFVPTGQPLIGTPTSGSSEPVDTTIPLSPYSFSGQSAADWTASVAHFDPANSPTPLRLTFADGTHLTLTLHTVDGLRQTPQLPGITTQPRHFDGTIEVPPDILNSPAAQPSPIRNFLESTLGSAKFTDTPVIVTESEFRIPALNLALGRTS
ncbi:hypothetical protein AB0H76_38125 [Nocardia sp. NPDC050712]|uniref:hypothetical protein n=1 Tax=Nocardia sp. NPDC050712 TaxID=3155518 RepID=UPI0033F7A4A4